MRTAVVVDDDSDMRFLVDLFLRLHDVEVVGQGTDGAEAVELVRNVYPDLVILDLKMPKKSGLDALAEIRKALPGTTVVVFSAHITPQTRAALAGLGAWAVEKSDGLDALANAIEEAGGTAWTGAR